MKITRGNALHILEENGIAYGKSFLNGRAEPPSGDARAPFLRGYAAYILDKIDAGVQFGFDAPDPDKKGNTLRASIAEETEVYGLLCRSASALNGRERATRAKSEKSVEAVLRAYKAAAKREYSLSLDEPVCALLSSTRKELSSLREELEGLSAEGYGRCCLRAGNAPSRRESIMALTGAEERLSEAEEALERAIDGSSQQAEEDARFIIKTCMELRRKAVFSYLIIKNFPEAEDILTRAREWGERLTGVTAGNPRVKSNEAVKGEAAEACSDALARYCASPMGRISPSPIPQIDRDTAAFEEQLNFWKLHSRDALVPWAENLRDVKKNGSLFSETEISVRGEAFRAMQTEWERKYYAAVHAAEKILREEKNNGYHWDDKKKYDRLKQILYRWQDMTAEEISG